jgi:hypothetical protein
MPQCTAPVLGHIRGGAESCPACRGRSGYRSYGGGYSSHSSYVPSYSPPSYSAPSSGGGGSGGSRRPRWSRAGSSVVYTPAQVVTLTPFRESVEKRAVEKPDLRDAFLCHAWDDRLGIAKDLVDLLVARGATVWFSENDVGLGKPLLRAIDKGLANSRIGIVLVTPALISRIKGEGSIADLELSTLLRRNVLVPVVHDTSYEALQAVSPMLASRSGLNTAEDSMAVVADKLAELVKL